LQKDVFTNVDTGAGAFNLSCTGNFTAVLKARDIAGVEAVVNQWSFEVLHVDTDVPSYVPCILVSRVPGSRAHTHTHTRTHTHTHTHARARASKQECKQVPS
jgi:hypothetical protein